MKNLFEHLKVSRSKKLQEFFMLNGQRIKRYSIIVNELMKKKSLVVLFFILNLNSNLSLAHEVVNDSLRKQVFSLSPISKKVGQVNGVVLGVGIWEDEKPIIINGINIEIQPLAILGLLMIEPNKVTAPNSSNIKLNGLNISGGSFGNYSMKGLSLSGMNISHQIDGMGVTAVYNFLENANGIHVTGLYNSIENGHGVFVSVLFNKIEVLKGLSLGSINNSSINKGVQIGLININKSKKGFQLGLWNINEKRTLPLINW